LTNRRRAVAAVALLSTIVATLVAAVPTSVGAQTASDIGVTVRQNVVYRTVDGESLLLDAYVPETRTGRRPVALLVHGGSWRAGDKSNLVAEGGKLARLGYVAFSVNYRLAPAHPYPAAVDDVTAAVRWVRAAKQVKTYRLDPKRIGAIGASAGGHLVGLLATLGEGSLTTGARIKAAVSWSGPMDFNLWPLAAFAIFGGIATAVTDFLACTPDGKCPNATPASPISHVDSTDAPMLLANSDHELVGLDHATTMDAKLKAAGVPEQLVVFPGDRHAQGFADDIWPQTVAFLERYVGKPRPTS
jgi:acetyl esterase